MKAYLGLGSNLGDRGEFLKKAILALENLGVKIVKSSKIYESEPKENLNQPWFLNMAVEVETNFSPQELLKITNLVEKQLGRERSDNLKYQPRTIDIDILFYENLVLESDELQIPHPKIYERRFVLLPLSEISPNFLDPLTSRNLIQLLNECQDTAKVRLL